jgi:preflagellin peptidase FlaK
MSYQVLFAAANVAVTLIVLLYASWSDYKAREVSDKVWIIYGPIALAVSLASLLLYAPGDLVFYGLTVGLTVAFSLLLFYVGGFGGADAKAFMCIALALPAFPTVLLTPILAEGLSPISQFVFPVTILSNSVLVAAVMAVVLLVRNLARKTQNRTPLFEGSLAKESWGKKLLVLITGQRLPISALQEKWHIYPLEDITEQEGIQKRKLIVFPQDEGRDQILERLSKAAQDGKIDPKIWASPGLPMLIFVTVGVVISLVLGDVIWVVVSHILG